MGKPAFAHHGDLGAHTTECYAPLCLSHPWVRVISWGLCPFDRQKSYFRHENEKSKSLITDHFH
jgi:hypothetical protein